MNIDDVFNFGGESHTKRASENSAPPPSRPASAASAATQAAVAALTTPEHQKVASAGQSPDALEKIAAQVHGFTKTARAQEAAMFGTIMADSFVARIQDYEKVAAQHEAQGGANEAQFKAAQEMAAQATYDRTVAAIEKNAAEHYIEGHRAVAELFA